ncbi:MAG: hypothetical protein ACI4AM_09405 [Muribaculaceae bacterium]
MNTLFVRSRNRDFLNACRRRVNALTDEGHAPQSVEHLYAVAEHILTQPANAYYVDYYRACHILVDAVCKNTPPVAKYACSQVWVDMYHDLQDALKRHPTRPIRDLIFALCAGEIGHPRHYITARTARKIIRNNLHKFVTL